MYGSGSRTSAHEYVAHNIALNTAIVSYLGLCQSRESYTLPYRAFITAGFISFLVAAGLWKAQTVQTKPCSGSRLSPSSIRDDVIRMSSQIHVLHKINNNTKINSWSYVPLHSKTVRNAFPSVRKGIILRTNVNIPHGISTMIPHKGHSLARIVL